MGGFKALAVNVAVAVGQGSLDHVKVGPTPVLELHNL